jgi:MFS transporter, FHS family, L-fucose permease
MSSAFAPAPANSSAPRSGYALSIAIIGGLFFLFGFVTWLNGTLIPFLKLACELTTEQAFLVTFAFYLSYFVLALPSSAILRRTGFKRGMSVGLGIMAVGALVFIPAALTRNYALFLTGLFVQGMGLALLQTAVNPYISVIGPIKSAASRISIMGICNKAAGTLSPIILAAVLLGDASEIEKRITAATDVVERSALLQELSQRVITPYVVMAAVLVLLALMIRFSPLPDLDREGDEALDTPEAAGKASIFQFPHLLLGALCIFVYVGVEVMAGDAIAPYAQSLGVSLDQAKSLTSYTLLSMIVGYVVGILTIPKLMRQETALRWSAIIGVAFGAGAFFTEGKVSVAFIALLGLANALMWPAIFPLAIDGLGRFTKTGAALLIMGVVGGAIIPQIYARIATAMGHQGAFLACTLPCYLYILFYATKGYRVGRRTA